MNVDELTRQLIGETKIDDISESYRPVVEIIGVDKFIELSDYAKGDELYFPKIENIIAPARNRRIAVQFDVTFEGGIYADFTKKAVEIGNIQNGG